VARLYANGPQPLLDDVEKTLKIFEAMNAIRVAQRCASLTKEVLDLVKSALDNQDEDAAAPNSKQTTVEPEERQTKPQEPLPSQQLQSQFWGASVPSMYSARTATVDGSAAYDLSPTFQDVPGMASDDFFTNMMDVNFLNSFGANTLQFGGNFDLDFGNTGAMDWNMNDYPQYDNTWGY
jgi:hypothetical protein